MKKRIFTIIALFSLTLSLAAQADSDVTGGGCPPPPTKLSDTGSH